MADIVGSRVSASFTRELRSTLHYLYDWVTLRNSPLIELFGLEEQNDSSLALRRILTDAIEALKPNSSVPSRAKAWRTYQLLYARFIEQFTQAEAATDLGLSIRHLRREETVAIQMLAAYLWDHYDLGSKWQGEEGTLPPSGRAIAPADTRTPTKEQELEWLQASLPSEPIAVEEVIYPVLELVSSATEESNVSIEFNPSDSLPPVVVQHTPIRQALLTILTAAIHSVPGGQIVIEAGVDQSEVFVHIRAGGHRPVPKLSDDGTERLHVARQLIELSGGALTIGNGGDGRQSFTAKIALPAKERIPVLMIDDNLDTLRLLERCLTDTRYCFVGTSDPEQALQLATESGAQMIVLDVMLPDIDGWELLGRLREHPQTHDIPVIVCTILPQEELATDLGAAAFIHKPVSRKDLLLTLDRQLDLLRKASG